MPFFFLARSHHSPSHSQIGYTRKSKRGGGGKSSKKSSQPNFISIRIHLAPSLVFLGCDLPSWWYCRDGFLCARKKKKILPLLFFLTFLLQGLSSSLSFLSLCCACQGCQCHSLTWLVFLTWHQEADREQGEQARLRSHLKKSKAGGAQPPSSEGPWL